MKNISILVPKGQVALSCIEGAYTLFNKANDFLGAFGRNRVFEVQLVGLSKEPEVYDKSFTVYPDSALSEVKRTDLIIIPAINGQTKYVVGLNQNFIPWIQRQYKDGAEVASLCVGVFLLGATGLLKRRKCATHWQAANDFRKMYPEAIYVPDKIITDEHGIYSSGGGNSFWNLLLYLVEKYTDREMAIQCAKYFAIEIDRTNQSSFVVFEGQRDHEDESVKKAQAFIEDNIQYRITVDQLSSMVGVGRRTLERRFKKATFNTVSDYIHRVKIEVAKKGFETGRKAIDEIMRDVGYADTKAFRTIFKKTTGLSPLEYRNKYNREAGRSR
ncbi:MAG: GlxA family transcriptional regulator [Flavitalea sp.]